MKNLLYSILAILVIALIVTGVWRAAQWAQLRRFEKDDPVADARRALSSGDHRLLAGDYGWGLWLPADATQGGNGPRHRTKLVVRMSRDIASDRDEKLWHASRRYIARYDSVIVAAR